MGCRVALSRATVVASLVARDLCYFEGGVRESEYVKKLHCYHSWLSFTCILRKCLR